MKIKTQDLTGDNLGFAVALIEYPEWKDQGYLESVLDLYFDDGEHYAPWKNWAQGGPIIEREGITVFCVDDYEWAASFGATQYFKNETPLSPTPLIAAMRCFVASRLGDEVDVPDELVEVAYA